jgi:zinc transporter, ZIP family
MTMAIHNIPEGVAISLALVPRGLSVFFAVLWCILSSIPQPIFAVPSFMFVEQVRWSSHFILIRCQI